MIFGDWRGISFDDLHACRIPLMTGKNRKRKALTQRAQRRHRGRGDSWGGLLGEVGDFLVEVSKGGFERFAMVGVSSRSEVVRDAGPR